MRRIRSAIDGPARRVIPRLIGFGMALAALPLAAQAPCAVTLNDIAARAGIGFEHDHGGRGERHLPETMGSGIAWLDFDGDGWLDLYVVQSGPYPGDGSPAAANRLWRGLGGGRFVEVDAGAGDRGYGQGALAADFDGDGDVDLYVTNDGADALYRNRGDGRFDDATAGAFAAGGLSGWSTSAAMGDVDRDGDLDLYVARYLDYDPGHDRFCGDFASGARDYCGPELFAGVPDRLFRNLGDGRFADATAALGLDVPAGKGLGVVIVDLDADLVPEIYVANDQTVNLLLRSPTAGAAFEDLSFLAGVGTSGEGLPEAGMGLAVGDVDGDRLPDLAVTNFDVETNTLYRNLGDLQFVDRSLASGFGQPSFNRLGFGIVLADLDLDGDLDVYVANGHVRVRPRREQVAHAQADLVLLGDGGGRFTDAPCVTAEHTARVGRGLASADYDGDGDPDLALSNNDGPLALLENGSAGRPWLGVRLVGRAPNTEAIGAVVRLRDRAGRWQSRYIVAGDSYLSTSDKRALFGLAAEPVELEVLWPSGRRSVLRAPPVGVYLTLYEPVAPTP